MRNAKTIQRIRALFVCALVVFSFGATGEICGFFFKDRTTAFGSRFPDNKPRDIRKVLSKIDRAASSYSKPENSAGKPIAVLVVKGDPRALIGIELSSGKKLWRMSVPIGSELSLGGDFVVFKSGNQVVAYSLRNGQKQWDLDLDEGWDYYGADVNGDLAAVSLGVGGGEAGGYANGKIVVLKASNGYPVWEHGAGSGLVGEPVVVGDLVFVPWNRQKIVVIDVDEKEEICRVRAEDYSINYLRRGSGGVYFGSLSTKRSLGTLHRFNENAATGTSEGSTVFMPKLKPVPGVAHFGRDGFATAIGGRSTEEKIRFHWQPLHFKEDLVAMEGGKFYLHYWRYIFAFDAQSSKVVWSYISKENIESVQVLKGGHVIGANTSGRLFLLDGETGKEAWTLTTEEEILTAAFDADGFSTGATGGTPGDVVAGLKDVILDNDNRMLPIRGYAAHLLADIPRPEVTRDLLDIYSSPTSPKLLRDAVVEAVDKRTLGAEYMVEALKMRYDFLEQTQAPPMKIVAPALVNMKQKDSLPELLEHLMNHETPIENLNHILNAVEALGDASVVNPLMKFITLYHADSAFLGHEEILAKAAAVVLKFGEKEAAQKYIIATRQDLQTLTQLKAQLREVLDPAAVAAERAERKAKEEAARKAKEEAERKAKEAAFIPESLSRDDINKTIQENQSLLKPCVMSALKKSPGLQQIRLRFLLTGETGMVSEIRVLPNNIKGLRECMVQAFAKVQFRQFKTVRQMATYTISIESGTTEE